MREWILTVCSMILFIPLLLFNNGNNKTFKEIEARLLYMEEERENSIQRIDQRIDDTLKKLSEFQLHFTERVSTVEGYIMPRKPFHIKDSPKDEPKEN